MTASYKATLRQRTSIKAVFVEIDWMGEPVRFWTGLGDFDWQPDGYTADPVWTGTGSLGSISLPSSSGELQTSEMTLSLSVMNDEIEQRIDDDIRGGAVTVWAVRLDADYKVKSANVLRTGVADRAELDTQAGTVTVYALADFPFLSNQLIKKWSPEVQIAYLEGLELDPDTDTGFDLMHTMSEVSVGWFPPI